MSTNGEPPFDWGGEVNPLTDEEIAVGFESGQIKVVLGQGAPERSPEINAWLEDINRGFARYYRERVKALR
jgi:hypothetical protein